MGRWERGLAELSRWLNVVAGIAILAMMGLTCLDVVLRLGGRPLPGTYELVGFLGALVAAFAFAYTSLEKGHIAVEILAERMPQRIQTVFDVCSALGGAALFGLLTWQSALYAEDLRRSGEVSLTLGMPVFPFAFGIAAGSALLCLLLATEMVRHLRRILA